MNVRGERIIIFGDSLTHPGSDSAPTIQDITRSSDRASSAPGDLLGSFLLEQGASAVRTNAKVSRSAVSFIGNEPAAQLVANDQAFSPTKVIVMLGTNDAERDLTKTEQAMAQIRDAYRGMKAEVWAIGPMTYVGRGASLNDRATAVLGAMQRVFGSDKTIDARALSASADRAGDGIHFTQAGARAVAPQLASVLLTSRPKLSKPIRGILIGFAGILVIGFAAWSIKKRKLGAIGMLVEPRLVGPMLMAYDAKRALGELPSAITTKWKRGVSAYKKAIKSLEAGSDDWQAARKAHDRLYKIIDEAAGHAPGSYNDPEIHQLNAERDALPKIADAQEHGREVRRAHGEAEIKRLREEEREAKKPYDWMKR